MSEDTLSIFDDLYRIDIYKIRDSIIANKRPDSDMTPEEWAGFFGSEATNLPRGWSVDKDGMIKWDPTRAASDGYEKLKCECGSEATYGEGTPFHSPWCPKYSGK